MRLASRTLSLVFGIVKGKCHDTRGDQMPTIGADLVTLLVATTMIFELVGPLATRAALNRAGETGRASPRSARSLLSSDSQDP